MDNLTHTYINEMTLLNGNVGWICWCLYLVSSFIDRLGGAHHVDVGGGCGQHFIMTERNPRRWHGRDVVESIWRGVSVIWTGEVFVHQWRPGALSLRVGVSVITRSEMSCDGFLSRSTDISFWHSVVLLQLGNQLMYPKRKQSKQILNENTKRWWYTSYLKYKHHIIHS